MLPIISSTEYLALILIRMNINLFSVVKVNWRQVVYSDDLVSGIYFYVVREEDGSSITDKLIKVKY